MATSFYPNENLSFFQNYQEHTQQIAINLKHKFEQLSLMSEIEQSNKVSENIVSYFKLFDPLLDQYDYADEFVGATIVPLTLSIVAFSAICYAWNEALNALGVQFGVIDDDVKADEFTYGQCALIAIGIALASVLLAIISLIKSAISLVTRPVATILADEEDMFDKVIPDLRFTDTDTFSREYPMFA